MTLVGCTIFSRAYLSYARVLARSFRHAYPEVPFYALLCDRVEDAFDPSAEPFTMMTVEELDIPGFRDMAFRYHTVELCTAVKPHFLRHLLDTTGAGKLFFLDPDIMIGSRLEEAERVLDDASILLTPHLTQPAHGTDEFLEQKMLQVGVHNLGFIGLRRSDPALHMLDWWAQRLEYHCYDRREAGLFVDQKWMDLAPSLFEGVHVLRDQSYNVAYWNLQERVIGGTPGAWTVNGRPLRFFHFSSYNPLEPDMPARASDRITFAGRPDLRPVYEEYRQRQLHEGYAAMRPSTNAFAVYDNGEPIRASHRRLYEKLRIRQDFGDPFRTSGKDSFYRYVRQIDTGGAGPGKGQSI